MTTINVLETQPSSRYDELDPSQDGNKNTTFADLIIDGKSLYQMLKRHDLVPALGWGSEENQRQMIQYLLLKEPHDHLYYRYPILVCPLCGHEECGYISMKVDREEDVVIWKDFMLEHKNQPLNVGPFYFMWENYERAIQNTFGMVET
ncbi:oxidoreductase [Paenibacillus illinoisensis]|uniref:oxidoreductase n=1 Tax=Paenibacillus illinoisensis TaxID=59845 RepID=UPI002041F0F5|nr:oxidoreductase [Paenibacillus illinoisensis]MCM3206265.1 oxidoreductase [Paenibacillus illinoisensis]